LPEWRIGFVTTYFQGNGILLSPSLNTGQKILKAKEAVS